MIGSLTRNSIKLFFCFLAVMASGGLTLLMIITNYMATAVSFELLGYDKLPLYMDRLLGLFFLGFTGKATLTDLFALVVSIVIAFGLFFFFHLLFKIAQLLEDRRVYRLEGDTASLEIVMQRIWLHLGIAAAISIFLGFGIWWDLSLFLFRNVAGALALTDPDLALELSRWSIQVEEKADLWFISLSQIGAWGYFSITAISCLCLEYSVHKLGECFSLLMNAIDPDGPDGSSGPDPNVPDEIEGQVVPNYVAFNQAHTNDRHHQAEAINSDADHSPPNSTGPESEDSIAPPIFEQMPIDFSDNQAEPNTTAQDQEQRTAVIGSNNNKQTSRSSAINNRKQIVDPTDHKTVWDADYYNALFEEPDPQSA